MIGALLKCLGIFNVVLMSKTTKATVVGLGCVGMLPPVLLAQHNDVTGFDVDSDRVDQVNRRESTGTDPIVEGFLRGRGPALRVTVEKRGDDKGTNDAVIATPTTHDLDTSRFDTSSVDDIVDNALACAKSMSCHLRVMSSLNE